MMIMKGIKHILFSLVLFLGVAVLTLGGMTNVENHSAAEELRTTE